MTPAPRWHAALSYALLGEVPAGLAEPGGVDVPLLLADLDRCRVGGLAAVRAELSARRNRGEPLHRLPDDLRAGLAPAQFASALGALQQALLTAPARVRAARALDGDERRLQSDVPPHHGS